MLRPSQYALKLPATSPERMFSDAPPSREEVTTSFTWRDSVEVKTFTSSGMMAPANVPQEMIIDNFHHNVSSPPMVGMMSFETMNVRATEITEVIQTRDVSGASKFICAAALYRALAIRSLIK